jgi:hypothetical protein
MSFEAIHPVAKTLPGLEGVSPHVESQKRRRQSPKTGQRAAIAGADTGTDK